MTSGSEAPEAQEQAKSPPKKEKQRKYRRFILVGWRVARIILEWVKAKGLALWEWWFESIRKPDNLPHNATAIFTLALAIFAYYAWNESKRGTEALQGQLKAMQAEQRPFIWITNDLVSGTLSVPAGATKGRFIITVHYTNFGHNVAYRFDRRLFIKVNGGHYVKSFGDPDSSMVGKGTGAIPPGKIDFLSAATGPNAVSQLDADWMTRTDLSYGIRMDFQYFDGYGNEFTDTVCEENLASGAMMYRPKETCKK